MLMRQLQRRRRRSLPLRRFGFRRRLTSAARAPNSICVRARPALLWQSIAGSDWHSDCMGRRRQRVCRGPIGRPAPHSPSQRVRPANESLGSLAERAHFGLGCSHCARLRLFVRTRTTPEPASRGAKTAPRPPNTKSHCRRHGRRKRSTWSGAFFLRPIRASGRAAPQSATQIIPLCVCARRH